MEVRVVEAEGLALSQRLSLPTVIPGAAGRTRKLEIPGSRFASPGMTVAGVTNSGTDSASGANDASGRCGAGDGDVNAS